MPNKQYHQQSPKSTSSNMSSIKSNDSVDSFSSKLINKIINQRTINSTDLQNQPSTSQSSNSKSQKISLIVNNQQQSANLNTDYNQETLEFNNNYYYNHQIYNLLVYENNKLTQKNDFLEKQKTKKLENEIEDLKIENYQQRRWKNDYRAEFEISKRSLYINKLKNQQNELNEKNIELENKEKIIQKLKNRNKNLKNELNEKNIELENKEKIIQKLKNRNKNLKNKLNKLNQEIKEKIIQKLKNRKKTDKLISNNTINHNSNSFLENWSVEQLNPNNFDSSIKNKVNHQEQQPSTSTGIYHSNSGL